MMNETLPTRTIRVAILDDHAIVRSGLRMILEEEPDLVVCGEASNLDEARHILKTETPDVMLVDISLKQENGLDLVREARKAHPDVRCIILSMHDEKEFADRALRAGAAGYVMKENADEVAVEAIRKVLTGDLYLSPEVSTRILKKMVEEDSGEKPQHGVESLTDREKEIFECIGRGLSTRRIAEHLGLSARTVEVHRAHIKKKLRCEEAAQVVREAVRWVEQNT